MFSNGNSSGKMAQPLLLCAATLSHRFRPSKGSTMSIASQNLLKAFFNGKAAVGAASINSDAALQIEGFESLWLQTKQFPWPVVGPSGEIEQPGPMGSVSVIPAQLKTAQQGAIQFSETSNGAVMAFMENIVARGGVFNATAYEGTPDQFVRAYRLKSCFFVPDQADRDWENKTQVTLISGTLHFHYFGETIPGNVASL